MIVNHGALVECCRRAARRYDTNMARAMRRALGMRDWTEKPRRKRHEDTEEERYFHELEVRRQMRWTRDVASGD